MPIVTIQITREGTTREQKAALFQGATGASVACQSQSTGVSPGTDQGVKRTAIAIAISL